MKTVKKRRKQNKTDYLGRLKLLKSGKPRVVFRKTNKYIITQYITSKQAQDKIVFGFTSKDLMKNGWTKESGSLKSIPASYLTGYLIGKQIIKKGLKMPIVDFGMVRVLHKTKTYAFLKGLIDSGVEIKCEKGFPDEEKIKGKVDIEKIKLEIDKLK